MKKSTGRKTSRPKESLVLLGAGGHAKVIIDLIEQLNSHRIIGLVTPDPSEEEVCGYPILRSIPKTARRGIVALGDNWRRSLVAEATLKENPRFRFIAAVHPSAVIARGVSVGEGSVVMAGACLNTEAQIGRHVIVNTRASVDHECQIGNFASIGPGATLGGKTSLGEFTALGLGSSVIHEIAIGAHTVIGAGGVVVENIPDLVVAYGNPCRVIRPRRKGDPYLATRR